MISIDDILKREIGLLETGNHSLGVKQDGTVIGAGRSTSGQIDAGSLSNVISVACGENHSLVLHENGIVSGFGNSSSNRILVNNWSDVTQISAGNQHSAGLKKNGTVYATGNSSGYSGIENLTDIVQISAGYETVIGLRADGTVVGAGLSTAISGLDLFTDVVQVAGGRFYTAILKSNGTVRINNTFNTSNLKTEAESWTDIVQISSGQSHIIGLRADGTVVGAGLSTAISNIGDWTNVIQIAAGTNSCLGLSANGTVLGAGDNQSGQIDTESWILSTGQFYEIEGITTIDDVPASMEVRAYDAQTGAIQIKGQSDATGAYSLRIPRWYNAYVMSIPPAGHRPQVHGPITRPDELDITPAP